MCRTIGEAALVVAEGYRRRMNEDDLAQAEAVANFRYDRRTALESPEKVVQTPLDILDDGLPMLAPSETFAEDRAEALARWQAAGGYWALVPTWLRSALAALGVTGAAHGLPGAAPSGAARYGDDDGGGTSEASTQALDATAVTRPLTSARDLSKARHGERTQEDVLLPNDLDVNEALEEEARIVQDQLAAMGVMITYEPRQLKLPPFAMYGGGQQVRTDGSDSA